jgi:hypothetical protein
VDIERVFSVPFGPVRVFDEWQRVRITVDDL